jgi:hypothetical protein
MNISYGKKLEATLPAELRQSADKATMAALGDPKSLLSPTARNDLKAKLSKAGTDGDELFTKTLRSVRASMEAGLKSVFLLGAVAMLISFLLILGVPEVSMDAVVEDKKQQPVAAKEPAG